MFRSDNSPLVPHMVELPLSLLARLRRLPPGECDEVIEETLECIVADPTQPTERRLAATLLLYHDTAPAVPPHSLLVSAILGEANVAPTDDDEANVAAAEQAVRNSESPPDPDQSLPDEVVELAIRLRAALISARVSGYVQVWGRDLDATWLDYSIKGELSNPACHVHERLDNLRDLVQACVDCGRSAGKAVPA